MATLYLVSTPIGNLGDLTRRAQEVLAEADRVLAEDTRRTRTLLTHLGLRTPMTSLHAHNEASRIALILKWLSAGEELALVSDAGTPLVSDPGSRVVEAVVKAGFRVVPIPGPSAVLAALVGAGLPFHRFTFLGFLPRKGKERKALLERVASASETSVLFESPERLGRLLDGLAVACGAGRRGAVAREVTKLHEEFVRGTLAELREWFEAHPPRGEITVVVAGLSADDGAEASGGEALEEEAHSLGRALLESGMPASRVARELARQLGLPRNRAYGLVQDLVEHSVADPDSVGEDRGEPGG
ncbi:16S rRNA (cytidine(1402)-2'-O)-methyltransferase, partial [Gemmatimonadota bacterium]